MDSRISDCAGSACRVLWPRGADASDARSRRQSLKPLVCAWDDRRSAILEALYSRASASHCMFAKAIRYALLSRTAGFSSACCFSSEETHHETPLFAAAIAALMAICAFAADFIVRPGRWELAESKAGEQ